LGDPELVLRGTKCELHAEFERGDFAMACRRAREMRELADRVKQPEYLRLGHMWDSLVAGIQGRFDDAEAEAQAAYDIFRRSGHSQTGAITVGLSITWMWLQGRMAEMEPLMVAGETGRSSLGEQALFSWIAVEAGQPDTARSILDRLSPESVAAADRNFHWWFTMVGLSQSVTSLGDARWAAALYELILPFSSHNCRVGQATFLGSAHYYLGLLSTTAGRPEQAVAHLEQALERHHAMEARPFVELTERAIDAACGSHRGSAQLVREPSAPRAG
jgi:hypothetical protein